MSAQLRVCWASTDTAEGRRSGRLAYNVRMQNTEFVILYNYLKLRLVIFAQLHVHIDHPVKFELIDNFHLKSVRGGGGAPSCVFTW